jgi:hypothetical protein
MVTFSILGGGAMAPLVPPLNPPLKFDPILFEESGGKHFHYNPLFLENNIVNFYYFRRNC